MGNSLIQGCTGHSLAQAAVAGTAIVLGPHAGKQRTPGAQATSQSLHPRGANIPQTFCFPAFPR